MGSSVPDFNSVIFSEWFWLGETNLTWKDFENKPGGITLPQPRDLYLCLVLAPLLVLLRAIVEKFAISPLGHHLGISDKKSRRKPFENVVLQTFFTSNRVPNQTDIYTLAKQTDHTPRQIERWFRLQRNLHRPSPRKRFTEAVWVFICYTALFTWGILISFNKHWFLDAIECFIDFSKQDLKPEIYWFYIAETTAYFSFLITISFDVKRKDSVQLAIHHVVTLFLLWLSWSLNFVRVGVLICVLHDFNDVPLELGKISTYLKKENSGTAIFAIFFLSWILTRCYLFPFRILSPIIFDVMKVTGYAPIYYLFSGLLIMIQCLDLFWTFLIGKVLWKKIVTHKLQDVRSSDEDEVDSDVISNGHVKDGISNGHTCMN